MTSQGVNAEIEQWADTEAQKILDSVKSRQQEQFFRIGPGNLGPIHLHAALFVYEDLRVKITRILKLPELIRKSEAAALADLAASLRAAHMRVVLGKERHQIDIDHLNPAFFLEYSEKIVMEGKDLMDFYKSYFVVALVKLVDFEELLAASADELEGANTPEKEASFYRSAVGFMDALSSAQFAVQIGTESLGRYLKVKGADQELQDILDNHPPALRLVVGSKRARLASHQKKVDTYLPLINEVDELKKQKGKKNMTDIFKQVAEDKCNPGTLKGHYYRYRKNPDHWL